eukprot:TRINITY_DN33498_c0_g1_i1.p1 TRINITY_DN33498_c0_g1~~TRINITY_DN33498_c0_g1_i1.p1  ORF type:complete len:120 (-),score=2.95 TRINITY_DN33498_c0_g1_i1:1671-2030(-)
MSIFDSKFLLICASRLWKSAWLGKSNTRDSLASGCAHTNRRRYPVHILSRLRIPPAKRDGMKASCNCACTDLTCVRTFVRAAAFLGGMHVMAASKSSAITQNMRYSIFAHRCSNHAAFS